MKNEKQKEKVVDDEMRRGKSEANTEKKDTTPNQFVVHVGLIQFGIKHHTLDFDPSTTIEIQSA